MVAVPRSSLGILVSSKGLVYGPILVKTPQGRQIDCSEGVQSIAGDCEGIQDFHFECNAR